MWHVSSRSGVATLRTAIHLLLYTARDETRQFCELGTKPQMWACARKWQTMRALTMSLSLLRSARTAWDLDTPACDMTSSMSWADRPVSSTYITHKQTAASSRHLVPPINYMWDREPFSFACIFLILDRNWWFFSTYIRPKESRSISYNSVYLISACVKNFAATVTLDVYASQWSNEIDDYRYRLMLIVSISLLRKILNAGQN